MVSLLSIPDKLSSSFSHEWWYWLLQEERGQIFESRAHLSAALFLVIPFTMLAQQKDRRLLLVINAISTLCSILFTIIIDRLSHWSYSFKLWPSRQWYNNHQWSHSSDTKHQPQILMAGKSLQPSRRRGCCTFHIAAKYHSRKCRNRTVVSATHPINSKHLAISLIEVLFCTCYPVSACWCDWAE